jgi:ribonuclease T2
MRVRKPILTFLISVASLLGVNSLVTAQEVDPPTAVAGQFDYYMLSLSWAPEYCHSHSSDTYECGQGKTFVLHGLWPDYYPTADGGQYNDGGYPANCTNDPLTDAATSAYPNLFASPNLAQHEWPKHGTCSGLVDSNGAEDPMQYFALVQKVYQAVTIPSNYSGATGTFTTTASQIAQDFANADPSGTLTPASVVPSCASKKYLSEVYVCYAQDGSAPTQCGSDIVQTSQKSCPGNITVTGP